MKWRFMVKRDLSPVFYDFINSGQLRHKMKEYLNVDFSYENIRVIESLVYYGEKDINTQKEFVEKAYRKEGIVFLRRIIKLWKGFFEELQETTNKIAETDYSKRTDKELITDFNNLAKAYERCSTALNAPLTFGRFAEEIIHERLKGRPEEYFNILTAAEKENEGTKELKELLAIAIEKKEGKDIEKRIKEHIKRFGWINTRGFYDNVWSAKEVKERIALIQNPKERLEKLNEHTKKVKEETAKVLDTINADKPFRDFVAWTKEIVFFRTERMDLFVKYGFNARPLFREIAKRNNLEMHDVFYLIVDEIRTLLTKKKDFRKIIEERKKGFARIQIDGHVEMLSGKELQEYKNKEMTQTVDKNIQEVKGNIAFKGIVQGTAKIILDKKDAKKVEKEDILIASMTTPDLIQAMELAAAFVTDEGGILCHAAIVSREMHKPCVMGTKIATKVFKDGDLIEVDANKGIVRKLK